MKIHVYQNLDNFLECPHFEEFFSHVHDSFKREESSYIDQTNFWFYSSEQWSKVELTKPQKINYIDYDLIEKLYVACYSPDVDSYNFLIKNENSEYVYLTSEFDGQFGYIINLWINSDFAKILPQIQAKDLKIIQHFNIQLPT